MRSTSSRDAALLVLVGALLAGACDYEDDRALVSFTVFSAADGIDPDLVTIRFGGGRSVRTITGEDFSGSTARKDTREFETATSGALRVDVDLRNGGEQVAAGRVVIPLRSDWRWNVSLFLGDENPTDTCFGCFGYEAFGVAPSLRDSPADSLWVVWGGNSISDPVVY